MSAELLPLESLDSDVLERAGIIIGPLMVGTEEIVAAVHDMFEPRSGSNGFNQSLVSFDDLESLRADSDGVVATGLYGLLAYNYSLETGARQLRYDGLTFRRSLGLHEDETLYTADYLHVDAGSSRSQANSVTALAPTHYVLDPEHPEVRGHALQKKDSGLSPKRYVAPANTLVSHLNDVLHVRPETARTAGRASIISVLDINDR